MFVPPLMTLLSGEPTPTPFYSATRVLNSDWITAIGPSAQYFPALDKTLVTWQMVGNGSEKGAQIAAYDHATGTWSERYKVGTFTGLADDDHGGTSLCQDADGYFYVFFGSHDSFQRWSTSNAPNDISAWTQQSSITGEQTYPRARFVGSKIFLFLRNDTTATGSPGAGWNLATALRQATPSGGAATFGSMSNLVALDADSRAYGGTLIVVGSDIHWVGTRADAADTARKHVYYFVYKTATGALENHDGSVSTASGSLPINLTTANTSYRLFDHGAGRGEIPAMCFDSAGDPHVVFADNGGSGSSFVLKHIKRTAGTWSSPVTVDNLIAQFPGIGFVTTYSVVAGAAGTVEAWYMGSGGSKVRRIRSSSGTWGAAQTIVPSGANHISGNQPVIDGVPELRTIFCEASGSFTDAGAVLSKRYGYGDGGAISASIPMTAQDANYSSVSLLFSFDHKDAIASAINEADSCIPPTFNGNAQIDTAQFKFGTASLLLDGSGDYVTFPNNSLFSVSQGDFCIEAFVRRNASKLQCVFGKRPAVGSSEFSCLIDASNHILFQAFNTSVAVVSIAGTTTITTGWHHVAYSRQGTTWRCFVDGNLEASATESASPSSNSQLLHVGRDPSTTPGRDFNGWIDEVRFTSGAARYTASFTAPSAAFPRR